MHGCNGSDREALCCSSEAGGAYAMPLALLRAKRRLVLRDGELDQQGVRPSLLGSGQRERSLPVSASAEAESCRPWRSADLVNSRVRLAVLVRVRSRRTPRAPTANRRPPLASAWEAGGRRPPVTPVERLAQRRPRRHPLMEASASMSTASPSRSQPPQSTVFRSPSRASMRSFPGPPDRRPRRRRR